jgi:hypothetical protein
MTCLTVPERCNLAWIHPAVLRLHLIVLQLLEGDKGGLHHIENIAAAQRFAQNIIDATAFDNGAHPSTGDNARAWVGRLQQYFTCTKLGLYGMGNRRSEQRNLHHAFARPIPGFADRIWHFTCLADANTNTAFFITNYNDCTESEATAALDNLGCSCNVNNSLVQLFAFLALWTIAAAAVTPTTAAIAFAALTATVSSSFSSS